MLLRRITLPREALIAAAAAASLTAILLWTGPPGVDLAAHLYQRTLFLKHGFVLWNNFWYAGRYSFVTYSVLYYPLAGLVGIKVLALASIATAALAFAMVLEREWGATARLSSLSFAVVWAGTALSAAFPFALGAALALLSLWALQAGRRGRFVLLAVLTLVYLAACVAAFVVPSQLGENIERVRYAAIPLAVLALSLRRWRPLWLAVPALALAVSWNVTPLAANFTHSRSGGDDAQPTYWQPAITYLHAHLGPSYRVEAVDTLGHWAAVYLPDARIPLARGWYRQDDFPQNDVLYGKLGRGAYLSWLHRLAVRYVVLTDSAPDYSARAEATLLRSGRSGLVPVLRTRHLTLFAVPQPIALVTGPYPARVLRLGGTSMTLALGGPGRYRVAVRYSPYWSTTKGCVSEGSDEMLRIVTSNGGDVRLAFKVGAVRALETLVGSGADECNG